MSADFRHHGGKVREIPVVEDFFRQIGTDLAQHQEGIAKTALFIEEGSLKQGEQVGALLGEQTLFKLLGRTFIKSYMKA